MSTRQNNFGGVAVFIFVLFIMAGILQVFAFAKDEDRGPVTQGEFAKELAGRIDADAPREASIAESIRALDTMGIKPAEGWNEQRPMTKQDIEKVLVEAGRLQAEVLEGKKMESALKERGIVIPNEVDRRTVDDVLKDQNVNRLLQTPAISGPSIPYPKEGVGIIEKPTPRLEPLKISPPEEPEEPKEPLLEPPPQTIELPRPSGGGGQ